MAKVKSAQASAASAHNENKRSSFTLFALLSACAAAVLSSWVSEPSPSTLETFRENALVPSSKNFPYLFKSLPAELENHKAVPSSGSIPTWIDGTWVKSGFCVFESKSYKVKMLFDASGCGYSLDIKDGVASVSAKKLKSQYLQAFETDRYPHWRTFEEFEPPRTGFDRIATLVSQDQADNFLVNMVSYGKDRALAITDLAGGVELDLLSMKTRGPVAWNDSLETDSWNMISSAHPSKIASHPGKMFNYLLNLNYPLNLVQYGMRHVYKLFEVDVAARTRKLIANVPTRHHHYVHENALTHNYFIFIEFPFLWTVAGILQNTAIKNALKFCPSEGIRFKVVDLREGKLVREFHLANESFYAFHQVNAYEEGSRITMLMTAYDDIGYHLRHSFNVFDGHAGNQFDIPPATLRKVVIDLSTGKIEHEKIGDVDFELPIVNDLWRGRKNKYVYAHAKSVSNRQNGCKAGPNCGGTWWDTIVKVDLETGHEVARWRHNDFWPSEPAFVPRGKDTMEDDGVVLNVVLGEGQKSYLLILDAKDLAEVARIPLPSHIPYQSHGNWIPRT